MAVKIRLSRIGKIHAPVYRIVAIDSRKKRDGEALDILGTYNPLTGELVQFHQDRIEGWVSKGAVVTDAVKKLQKKHKKSAQVTAQV
ncbi:30S ribosomal protein S16 [Candidatus Dependentiae bacterium]|nr:30S ribosomal protein S16 [Candidatus Dependentiae bacterium]